MISEENFGYAPRCNYRRLTVGASINGAVLVAGQPGCNRQCVKDGEKMYRVGGPIADSGVVVQRFCQFKWKATLSV